MYIWCLSLSIYQLGISLWCFNHEELGLSMNEPRMQRFDQSMLDHWDDISPRMVGFQSTICSSVGWWTASLCSSERIIAGGIPPGNQTWLAGKVGHVHSCSWIVSCILLKSRVNFTVDTFQFWERHFGGWGNSHVRWRDQKSANCLDLLPIVRSTFHFLGSIAFLQKYLGGSGLLSSLQFFVGWQWLTSNPMFPKFGMSSHVSSTCPLVAVCWLPHQLVDIIALLFSRIRGHVLSSGCVPPFVLDESYSHLEKYLVDRRWCTFQNIFPPFFPNA